jgi:hypothetical protein
MVVFRCLRVPWQTDNVKPRSASQQTGYDSGIKIDKLRISLIWMSSMTGSHCWPLYFIKHSEDMRLYTTGFRISQFLTPAWNRYLQLHLLAGFFLGGGVIYDCYKKYYFFSCQILMKNCKLVIFSNVNICFKKEFEKPNDGVREKALSRSPGNKAREIPFVSTILSVLRNRTDFAPCPGVKMYRLTSMLCQPLSLSCFGCPCILSGIKNWRSFDHCLPKFDGRGGGSPS